MTAWLPSIGFHQPLWLWLMPLIVALYLLQARQPSWPRRLAAFADRHLLRWLVLAPGARQRSWPGLLAACLIALAASGPYLADAGHAAPRRSLSLALVIDISPSMAADDVAPSRLGRARLEAHDFLDRLGSDRVALLAFSAGAYRVLPLTVDLPLVATYVDALDPGLTRHQGSNLVQALELAAQTLPERGRGRAIVLLSDGEVPDGPAVLQAADRLAAAGIPVFALGIGTPTGAPVPAAEGGYVRTADGAFAVSRLDRGLLQAMARRTGGRYADARADDRDWDELFAGMQRLSRDRLADAAAEPGYPLFPWILALGLGLILWAGHQRPAQLAGLIVALPLLGGTLFVPPAQAAPWTELSAYEALNAGRYAEAATLYERIDDYDGWLGRGAAAYRQGDWPAALASFAQAAARADNAEKGARALYDHANTLVRMGRLEEALGEFDRTLALFPNQPRASLNRDLVSRALEQRRSHAPDEATPPTITETSPNRSGGGQPEGANGRTQATAGPAGAAAGNAGTEQPSPAAGADGGTERAPATVPLGPAARSAMAGLMALSDDPREVLRHRFMVSDANHPAPAEAQPW